jgi:hypothetical protein
VALTRKKVAAQIEQLRDVAAAKGIPTAYRDGRPVTEEAIDAAYRDVKECIFCGKRSQEMHFGLMDVGPALSVALGGPPVRQARTLLYGLCAAHGTMARKDPDYWTAKLDDRLRDGLRKRIDEAARTN